MKTVDVKNNLIINKLVKKHFSLTEKSQNLFTHRLLYERDIPKEYADVLKGSSDLRTRFDLNDEFMESFDNSWGLFSNIFQNYVYERNITYKDYSRNKVVVNKNEKKIVKDIVDFYYNLFEDWLYDRKDISIFNEFVSVYGYYFFEDFKHSIKSFIYKEKGFKPSFASASSIVTAVEFVKAFLGKKDLSGLKVDNYTEEGVSLEEALSKEDKENLFSFLKKNLFDYIDKETRRKFESIVQKKPFANKKLQLVISLNYADWFMASTGDSWSSCISLYSTYDECYWTGLPTLIGDKSRAMVYITEKDGEKKNFAGIKVDKFLARTWMQIFRTVPPRETDGERNYRNSKTFFATIRSYPIELGNMNKVLENFMTIPSITTALYDYERDYKIVSKYYAENLWFKENSRGKETFTTIYLDEGVYKIAKKNKAKYFPGEYGYYKFRNGGQAFRYERTPGSDFIEHADDFLSSGISFAEIIDERSTLLNEIERYFDGYHRDEEDDYYDEEHDEEYDEVI
jgi:hypothetical protein